MSLSPSATVNLGNLVYDTHVASVRTTLAPLPGVNTFCVTLSSGTQISVAPGASGSLELDGGEGARSVLTGRVRAFRRGLLGTEVSVADGGADLGELRPAATYERQNAKEVIRALAAEKGLRIGTLDLDLPLAAYVAHQDRTAAEHIAYLAQLAGTVANFDGEGTLDVIAPKGRPEVALLYGREIIDYEVRERPGAQIRRVAIGSGPAGTTEAPDALRHSNSALPGDAPTPGRDAVWRPAPILRTPKAAVTASRAAEADASASASRIRATGFLLPALRPGMVVEVQELPDELSEGPWLLTRVIHQLKPGLGGRTTFEGRSAGSGGGPGSLLEAGLSAAGGLL